MVETILQVRRTIEPIGTRACQWEQGPYEVTVWEYAGRAQARSFPLPPDHVPGLLRCYINDHKVNLGTFVTALQGIGMTLSDVEQQINGANVGNHK